MANIYRKKGAKGRQKEDGGMIWSKQPKKTGLER